jgi:hypothetical protein
MERPHLCLLNLLKISKKSATRPNPGSRVFLSGQRGSLSSSHTSGYLDAARLMAMSSTTRALTDDSIAGSLNISKPPSASLGAKRIRDQGNTGGHDSSQKRPCIQSASVRKLRSGFLSLEECARKSVNDFYIKMFL